MARVARLCRSTRWIHAASLGVSAKSSSAPHVRHVASASYQLSDSSAASWAAAVERIKRFKREWTGRKSSRSAAHFALPLLHVDVCQFNATSAICALAVVSGHLVAVDVVAAAAREISTKEPVQLKNLNKCNCGAMCSAETHFLLEAHRFQTMFIVNRVHKCYWRETLFRSYSSWELI